MMVVRLIVALGVLAAVVISLPDAAPVPPALAREPYFYFPGGTSPPLALTPGASSTAENCDLYQADIVSGIIDDSSAPSFAAWAHRMGFRAEMPLPAVEVDDHTIVRSVEVYVPPGAARAALPLAKARPGVVAMGLSGMGNIDLTTTRCPGLLGGWHCELDGPQWLVRVDFARSPKFTAYARGLGLRLVWARQSYHGGDNGHIDVLWLAGIPAADTRAITQNLDHAPGIASAELLLGGARIAPAAPCPARS